MREQEIIERLRAREEQGAEALMRQYGPLMRYVIAPILQNAQDREECFSEALLSAWEKIESFDAQRGSFAAWLTAVARNAALGRVRREKRAGQLEPLSEHMASAQPTPEQQLLQRERSSRLVSALSGLSERDRLMFYRKYYYRQPTAQIAAELGMTPRAVEGRLYRIKKRLRAQLGGDGNERP